MWRGAASPYGLLMDVSLFLATSQDALNVGHSGLPSMLILFAIHPSLRLPCPSPTKPSLCASYLSEATPVGTSFSAIEGSDCICWDMPPIAKKFYFCLSSFISRKQKAVAPRQRFLDIHNQLVSADEVALLSFYFMNTWNIYTNRNALFESISVIEKLLGFFSP